MALVVLWYVLYLLIGPQVPRSDGAELHTSYYSRSLDVARSYCSILGLLLGPGSVSLVALLPYNLGKQAYFIPYNLGKWWSSTYTSLVVPFPSLVCAKKSAKMSAKNETGLFDEKLVNDGSPPCVDPEDRESVATGHNVLHRDLKGRHMQMIAM